MGLGQRGARRHETAGAQKHAGVRSEDYWDFAPDQHVMTVDGVGGIVTAVLDGPYPGNETYEVTLDNGLGGGQYTASQLSSADRTTASVDHTAADDYPELGSILSERPDPALQRYAAQGGDNPFEFRHEEVDTGGTKFPRRVDTTVHHPETGEQVGSSRYFPPKRRGGPISIDEVRAHAPGVGSAILNEIEGRHPGSSTKFLHEVKRNNNNPDKTGHAHERAGGESDWDTHYPNLASTVHRGFSLRLPSYSARTVNSSASTKDEHLTELHAAIPQGPAIGTHWTENEHAARQFAHNAVSDHRTDIPVVLHASTPARKDIETRREHLYRGGVFPYGDEHSPENEVPVRKGRQVAVTGISWRPDAAHPEADEDGWVHHTYDEARHHTAARAQEHEISHVYRGVHGPDAQGAAEAHRRGELGSGMYGKGVYVTSSPDLATGYAQAYNGDRSGVFMHGQVHPDATVGHLDDVPKHVQHGTETDWARERGHDVLTDGSNTHIVVNPHAVTWDPKNYSTGEAYKKFNRWGEDYNGGPDDLLGHHTALLSEEDDDAAGSGGDVVEPAGADDAEDPSGQAAPASCSYCGATEFTNLTDNGRSGQATCAVCGGTMSSAGGTGQWTPELIGDPSNHPKGNADPASGGVSGAAGATDPLIRDQSRMASRYERTSPTGWHYDTSISGRTKVTSPSGETSEHYNDLMGNGIKQHRHHEDMPVPLYHGMNRPLEGEQIEPGRPGNFVKRMKHVYMTEDPNTARHYAGPRGKVYEVHPTGWYGHRSDAKGADWASEHPLNIVREVPHHEAPGYDPGTGELKQVDASIREARALFQQAAVIPSETCGTCKGEGTVSWSDVDPDWQGDPDENPGKVHTEKCDDCGGTGRTSETSDEELAAARKEVEERRARSAAEHVRTKHPVGEMVTYHDVKGCGPNCPVGKEWDKHRQPFRYTGGLSHSKEAAVDGPDWCTWRRMAQCTYPNDRANNLLALPQVRGACPWTTRWEQQVCPISEPGPMALMEHKGSKALSWDDIGDRHPHVYGDSEIHGDAADGADGPGIGDAANYLAHERPGHQDAEDSSVHDMTFREEMVHPRHIDYSPSGPSDHRVMRAREGYSRHPDEMPPLVLVKRHNVYQVADGHHRAEAAHGLDMPVKAYVADSPHNDEPFADGHKGAFYNAEPIEPGEDKRGSWERHNADEHGELAGPELDDNPSYTRKRHDKIYPGCSFTGALRRLSEEGNQNGHPGSEEVKQAGLPLLHEDDTHEERVNKLTQHYDHLRQKMSWDSAYEDGEHPLYSHHQEYGVPSFNHATHSEVDSHTRAVVASHLSRDIASTRPAWPPTVDIEKPGDSDASDGVKSDESAIYHPYGNHIVVNHNVAHDPREGGHKDEGWYSHTGDASPLGHVLTHEYGHFLENQAFKGDDGAQRRDEMLREVSRRIPGATQFDGGNPEEWLARNREHVSRHVGGYAATHTHELIPELYAEHRHGVEPSDAAHEVAKGLGVQQVKRSASLRRLSEEDYRMQHQAPDAEGGAPAHDLTGNGVFPADVYTHPHYYDTYHPDYNSVHSTLRAAQGNPEKKIRIYRALPAEHAHKGFNTGDWVSTSKEYARDHGRHHEDPKHDWPVISTSVPAKHIHTEGDLMEWGYNGPPKGGSVAFKGGHHQEVSQRADGSVKPVQRKPKSPERQTADKLKDAGYSFSHYGGSEGHTVAAYGPDENWAGMIKAHPDGTVHHVEIDPEHAHMPLEEHMRSMIPGAMKKEASVTPDETREMVRLARKDSEFGFHVIATWADVRNKAKRIRREGGVTIKVATNQGLAGDVQGDHGRYETMITYRPGTQKIADWKCGCKWGDWAFQRVRFYGRQCSHSLALQYEAQSRGMFGRDVHLGMRDAFGTRPIEVLASTLVEVEDPGDVMKILMAFGLQHSGARQVLDTVLGRTAAWPDDEDDDEGELPDHQRDEHGDCVFYPGHEHEHYDDEDQGSKQCPYQDGHTDWNRVHPHLGSEIHRGMSIDLHRAGVHDLVHNDSVSMSERAHAISQHLSEDHLGTHWTDKQDTAKHYTYVNGDGPNGHHTKVVLHAEKPERHEIEEDPEELANGDVIGYGNHDDREVPLQHGGDVRVKGISWHSGDQWHRHDFGQPRQHIAAKTHMCPHCGHEVAEDARTCPECGNRLTEDVPELHEASRVAAEHEPVYLRFGDWSDDERSHNNVTGFKEDGVSVYDLDHHGNPKDPDPDFNRGHEHDEHCEPDCDLDSWNDDYGNDTREEMEGRVRRAERNRANGYHRPGEEPHLVKGDMVSIGHDGEPLLNNVRRVGDWIDHRHHFIPGAEPHRLARHPDDEDYEPPEEHPGGHTAKRKKKHEHAEDARKHAPQFGYGVPGWGLPILWCPQCTGGGCGHCGGTGQVTQAPASSPSTTADPVPDQNPDAGSMTTDGISAVSAREEFRRLQASEQKQDGPSCSGVALKAADTGRVLMLQRGLDDPDDPAAGTWEFPGGHHEDGDVTSLHAGIREWQEEVGQPFPEGGVVHHTWTSPSGVYQGHVVVIPSEKDLAMHEGRVIPNPDDPKGDHHEQAAWWDIDHAKGNKVLRDEVRSGTPWKEIAKAGETKTAAAWDSLSSIDPQPGRGTSAPGHSVSQNPASTGPFTAQDPASWDELNTRENLAPDMSYDSTLHAQPEPALPSTDGAAEEDEHGLGWLRPGTHQYEVPDTNSEISDIDQSVTPNSYHGAVARAAEAAVKEPSGVSAIVARFQASAAAQGIMAGSAQPAEGGDDVSFDFTAAAREHLAKRSMAKTALKDFDFAEQQALINEGKREGTRARNFGDLQIEGTHYQHLEAALGLDEADSEDLFA